MGARGSLIAAAFAEIRVVVVRDARQFQKGQVTVDVSSAGLKVVCQTGRIPAPGPPKQGDDPDLDDLLPGNAPQRELSNNSSGTTNGGLLRFRWLGGHIAAVRDCDDNSADRELYPEKMYQSGF